MKNWRDVKCIEGMKSAEFCNKRRKEWGREPLKTASELWLEKPVESLEVSFPEVAEEDRLGGDRHFGFGRMQSELSLKLDNVVYTSETQ